MDQRSAIGLLEEIRVHFETPATTSANRVHFGVHQSKSFWLDAAGSQVLEDFVEGLRSWQEAGHYAVGDLRSIVVGAILDGHEAASTPESIYHKIVEEMNRGIQFYALFPIHSLSMPAECDLQVGDVRFFRMSDEGRGRYAQEHSQIVRTTRFAGRGDPSIGHTRLEADATDILGMSETWAEVSVWTRPGSASRLARDKLRDALSVVSLFLGFAKRNPEISAIMRWHQPRDRGTAHLVLAPGERAMQSREIIHLRVIETLGAADVRVIAGQPLFGRAAQAVFRPSSSDLDMRLANAILILARAENTDDVELKLPLCTSVLETLLRRPAERAIRHTVRERLVQLLRPADEAQLSKSFDEVYNGRNDLVHVRADRYVHQEMRIERLTDRGRQLAYAAIISALERWNPDLTFDAFIDGLGQHHPDSGVSPVPETPPDGISHPHASSAG